MITIDALFDRRNSIIMIDVDYPIEMITQVEDFYFNISKDLLLGRKIKLVTIEPQHYSIGREFAYHYELKIDRKKFLITEIDNCDVNTLRLIIGSEEFNRTLLIIVDIPDKLIDSDILLLSKCIEGDGSSRLPCIYCENDGRSLYLRNINYTENKILSNVDKNSTLVNFRVIN